MFCSACGKNLPDGSAFCLHCGAKLAGITQPSPQTPAPPAKAKNPTLTGCLGCFGLVVIVVVIAGIFGSFRDRTKSPSTTQPPTSSPSSSQALDRLISGDNWFGCVDREYYEKLGRYAAAKDMEVFRQALAVGLVAGTCARFKPGETVYIADTAMFSGLVKIRRKGEMIEYWTNFEAIR